MNNDLFSIDCPDCGDDFFLPAIEADQNCSFDLNESQVCDVYMQPKGAPNPFDFSQNPATATPDAIDNTATDNSKTKWLVGEGGVAAPEKNVVQLPKLREKISKRTYSLTFVVKNLSDEMYDFLRHLQCGWTGFTFYYATLSGRLFGRDGGIPVKSVDVDLPLGEGREDTEQATLTITWEAKTDPDRRVNPLAVAA